MPFNVYYDVKLEDLLQQFLINFAKKQPADPFEPAFIVVQTEGMKKWLSLKIAEYFAISANTKFFSPNSILDWASRKLIGIPAAADKKYLTWCIFSILPSLINDSNFDPIKRYLLADKNGVRLYQLSEKIADILDQYQVYRPHMMKKWESGYYVDQDNKPLENDYIWQAILWEHLSHETKINRANSLLKLSNLDFKSLTDTFGNSQKKTISLFGISVLPPIYVNILEKLGEIFDIQMFVQSPTREYFGTENFFYTSNADDIKDDINPLIASMGKTGSQFFDFIAAHIDYFSVQETCQISSNTILSSIQNDIMSLKTPERSSYSPDDSSIIVNACHSQIREIQVLYDQLIKYFEADSSLKPSDILVLSPNIDEYAAYIDAVFGTDSYGDIHFPYTIADRTLSEADFLTRIFLNILNLSHSRLKYSDIFQLLEKDVIHSNFQINQSDIEKLKLWSKQTNTKWGWDKNITDAFTLPFYSDFTVAKGLSRMHLAASVIPYKWGHFGDIACDISIEGEHFELLGKFTKFAYLLHYYWNVLQNDHTPKKWRSILSGIMHDFFNPSKTNTEQISSAIESFSNYTENLLEKEKLSTKVVEEYFISYFKNAVTTSGYLEGKITFCSMIPMRSIPYKIICLIGMNDSTFPRINKPMEFDLMAQYPKKGDRSPKDSDRYLFLETLMSAREKLYISYIGQSIKDNSEIPPSPLISEILEYINTIAPDSSVFIKHKLHPFSREYFTGDRQLKSYSKKNYSLAAYTQKPEGKDASKDILRCNFKNRLSADVRIDLANLVDFYMNPIRHYFVYSLETYPEDLLGDNYDTEPPKLDNLSKTIINNNMLNELFYNDTNITPQRLFQYFRKKGDIPPANYGDFLEVNSEHMVNAFAFKLNEYKQSFRQETVAVNLDVLNKNFLVSATLPLSDKGQILFKTSTLKPKDKIRAWLHHVVLNYAIAKNSLTHIENVETFFYAEDCTLSFGNPSFQYRDKEHFLWLENYLKKIIKLYLSGKSHPIALMPEFAYHYVKKLNSNKLSKNDFNKGWWSYNIFKFNDKIFFQKLYGDQLPNLRFLTKFAGIIYTPMINMENIQ